jgi:hypothetical protein
MSREQTLNIGQQSGLGQIEMLGINCLLPGLLFREFRGFIYL